MGDGEKRVDKPVTAEEEKQQAGRAAAELVENGMVVGLGTGSTAAHLVSALGDRLRRGDLRDVRGVATSRSTEELARRAGLPLLRFDGPAAPPSIDLTLDGADEVDPRWNLVKGGGGSLLREKIVAQASARLGIMVDRSKLVDQLGVRFALPIEVVPFGAATHEAYIRGLGGDPKLRTMPDGRVFLTDNGNWTIDISFGERGIDDPAVLHHQLRGRAGIVETGLFLGMTSILIVGPTCTTSADS